MKNSFLFVLFFAVLYCLDLVDQGDNYIIAVYKISEPQTMKIINSYEKSFDEGEMLSPFDDSYRNAWQIRDGQIYINGEKINSSYFSYTYFFPSKGVYTIKFEFNQCVSSYVL